MKCSLWIPWLGLLGVLLHANTAISQLAALKIQEQDWVRMWAMNNRDKQQFEKDARSDSDMRIALVDRVCELTDQQETKLRMAANADVVRFLRDCTRVRAQLKKMKVGNNDAQAAMNVVQPLMMRTQNGFFEQGSLFQKVLRSTLTHAQRQKHLAELERLRRKRWKVMTRANLVDLEKSMPLLKTQRERLLELLEAVDDPRNLTKNMDGHIGFMKLLKVDDDDLAEFLDKKQLAVIDQFRQRYQGWARMF